MVTPTEGKKRRVVVEKHEWRSGPEASTAAGDGEGGQKMQEPERAGAGKGFDLEPSRRLHVKLAVPAHSFHICEFSKPWIKSM